METDTTGKRQKKRDSLFLGAVVRPEVGQAFETRVRNLSPGGMMIDLPRELPLGTAVTVQLRGIDAVEGRIAWCTAGRAGVAFDEDIDPTIPRSAPSSTPNPRLPEYLRQPVGRRPGLAVR